MAAPPPGRRDLGRQLTGMFRPAGLDLAGVLLAVATPGMMFKQLRLVSGSFGLFEGLALLAVLILAGQTRGAVLWSRTGWPLLLALGGFVLGAGVAFVFFPDHFNPRDLLATLFVGLVLAGWLSLGARLDAALTLLRGLIGLYCLIILIGVALASGPLGFLWYKLIVPWRLQGLSDNPNQLASLCAAGIALGAIALARRGRIEAVDAGLLLATALAGLLSDSVAFIFAATLMPAAALLVWLLWFRRDDPGLARARRLFWLSALMVALLIGFWFGPRLAGAVHELYYGGTGKGVVRFAYWLEALRTALHSPLVGFGPGGHIAMAEVPALQEAHNVVLDLALSGGLLSLGAFAAVAGLAFGRIVQRRSLALLVAGLALVEFGLFQTVIRHAHYWVAWIALMAALRNGEAEG